MKKLLCIIPMLFLMSCDNPIELSYPDENGVELNWIASIDNYQGVDYLKYIYHIEGQEPNSNEYQFHTSKTLYECASINLYIPELFTYSLSIDPTVVISHTIYNIGTWVWSEK